MERQHPPHWLWRRKSPEWILICLRPRASAEPSPWPEDYSTLIDQVWVTFLRLREKDNHTQSTWNEGVSPEEAVIKEREKVQAKTAGVD